LPHDLKALVLPLVLRLAPPFHPFVHGREGDKAAVPHNAAVVVGCGGPHRQQNSSLSVLPNA